jgi:hypothetical protein
MGFGLPCLVEIMPLEFTFWIGFALPLGPPLGIARTVLVMLL